MSHSRVETADTWPKVKITQSFINKVNLLNNCPKKKQPRRNASVSARLDQQKKTVIKSRSDMQVDFCILGPTTIQPASQPIDRTEQPAHRLTPSMKSRQKALSF